MHFIVLIQSLTQNFVSIGGRSLPKVARRILYKSTRTYNTRANIKKKMENFDQENQVLREQVASMQAKMEELTSMKTEMEKLTQLVKLMAVTQQPPPPPPVRTQAETFASTVPEWTFCA